MFKPYDLLEALGQRADLERFAPHVRDARPGQVIEQRIVVQGIVRLWDRRDELGNDTAFFKDR